MTKLTRLRTRLLRLRRFWHMVRLATAYSALVVAMLLALGATMLLDWLLDMSAAQRVVVMVIGLGIVGWVFYRYVRPWLANHQDELDMALFVQTQEHIDSDLVAALQFESPVASGWGSPQLEQAVIDYVAEMGKGINVYRGISFRPLERRTLLVLAMALVWAGIFWRFPDYASVFFNRLLMRDRHYPTRTVIEGISINGQPVPPDDPGSSVVKVPSGRAVQFTVNCSYWRPARGRVRLTPSGGAGNIAFDLTAADPQSPSVYTGQHPRLPEVDAPEPIQYQVTLGDCTTQPGKLLVVPLPLPALGLEVVPPAYARARATAGRMPVGMRQVSVIEGSRVLLRLESKKPLGQAAVSIGDRSYAFRREPAAGADESAEHWICDRSDTPLAAVVEPLQFAIQVTDTDGWQMEQPIQGSVRIQPDQPPRIAGDTRTPYVLPTATPTIKYRAIDDFGLAKIAIVRQVIHADGRSGEEEEVSIYEYRPGKGKLQQEIDKTYTLSLDSLKLVKDDQLKITLKAVDYRGSRAGQPALSEPILFHVTDMEGILAMMTESDRRTDEQLKSMIERQLGIEGEK